MKKKLIVIFAIVIFLIGSIGFAVLTYVNAVKAPLKNGVTKIVADKGTFSAVVADNEGSFKNKLAIKIYNKINKVNISVKKGEYEFPQDITLEELIKSLDTGKYNTSVRRVTIPEGYTIEKIAATLDKNDVVAEEEFLKACKQYKLPEYIKEHKDRRYALEGYLFPDTYLFEKGMSADKIIGMMIKRFEEVFKSSVKDTGVKVEAKDVDRLVTKASVIEREVSKEDEKSLVSSVIENRIQEGMKLQIDATVLYAMGTHKDKVLYKDLKTESPYNTYYIKGLPVGPISNPGKESLMAAMKPESTDYLFYMTKDGTNHKFFKTYEEFLKYKNSK